MVAFTVAAMFLAYTDRVNLAVAVVAMREQFHWSQSVKGLVLAGFFIGYLLFQVASGALAQRFGGKRVLGLAVLWWSLFALLTPAAAGVSVAVLIGARVGLGLGEAAVLPASYELFSRWVPFTERTRSLALFLSGIPLGQIVGLVGTAYLTARLGWPATFYVFGALGLVWVAAFWRGVHNSPAADVGVSAAERALLPVPAPGAAAPTPWRKLLHSPLVLSFIAAHFCHNWALYVLVSWLPSYFHEHLGLSVQQSGWYSALPWLANFLALLSGGGIADAAIARGARPLGVRRALAATGLAGAALCLLSLPGASSAAGRAGPRLRHRGADRAGLRRLHRRAARHHSAARPDAHRLQQHARHHPRDRCGCAYRLAAGCHPQLHEHLRALGRHHRRGCAAARGDRARAGARALSSPA